MVLERFSYVSNVNTNRFIDILLRNCGELFMVNYQYVCLHSRHKSELLGTPEMSTMACGIIEIDTDALNNWPMFC